MRLKTFYANTMTEAMKMVRETLGDDAIIVATCEERGNAAVRVTAAVEPAFELRAGGAAGSDEWLQYDKEEESADIVSELTEIMLRHGVPGDVMDQVISCASVMGFEDPGIALIATMEQLFTYQPLPVTASRKATMMVGPPGSGKTLAVAKMAARGVMNNLSVGVISTDTIRAGGVEQLQAFTKLLNIDLRLAKTPQELFALSQEFQEMDQIIVDTSGLNPFDKHEVKLLAQLIGVLNARPVLVLPAGIDAEESGEMARIFSTIGVNEILPTRIDIARRLGGILAAAHAGSLSFSDYSNTPKVAQGLSPLTPKTLSRFLMPGAYRKQDIPNMRKNMPKMPSAKTGTTQ